MTKKLTMGLAAFLLLAVPGVPAQAWPVRIGIGIGLPCYYPYYGPRVYVAPAPVYVVPAPPPGYVIQNGTPVYVQQAPPTYASASSAPPPAPQASAVQPPPPSYYTNLPPQPIPVRP